jgi:uncharacterized membrane protein
MKLSQREFWRRLGRTVRAHFITGIITIVPPAATILILYWVFERIDNLLQPIIEAIWGRPIPGVGFGVTIVLIYLVGVIASNFIGKRLIQYGESLLPGMPIFRQLYQGIKQILESFSVPPGRKGYLRVVFIEFPRKGMKALGFVTNETTNESGEKSFHVFVPTSPNPTSGFLEIVGEDEITTTNISVENALRMIISAGRVTPEELSPTVQTKK